MSAESFLRQLEKGEKEVYSQGQELPSDETRREGKKAEEGIDISVGSAAPLRKHYILVGLHTCGDLGPTMLSYFAQSRHVIAIVIQNAKGKCRERTVIPLHPLTVLCVRQLLQVLQTPHYLGTP